MMLTLFKYFLFCVCVYVRNTLIGQYTDHNDEWDEYGYETILGQLKKKKKLRTNRLELKALAGIFM